MKQFELVTDICVLNITSYNIFEAIEKKCDNKCNLDCRNIYMHASTYIMKITRCENVLLVKHFMFRWIHE